MSERVEDPGYWIGANGIDNPEMAGLVQAALVSPGDWGAITVHRKNGGKVVVGPVSSFFLPDDEAEYAFSMMLNSYEE